MGGGRTVWTLHVQCKGEPTSLVRVVKDKSVEQLMDAVVEQGADTSNLCDIECIQNLKGDTLDPTSLVSDVLQDNDIIRLVRKASENGCVSPLAQGISLGKEESELHFSCGDHVCWVVDDDELELRVLVEYIKEGIQLHQKVVFVTPGEKDIARIPTAITREKILQALEMGHLSTEKYLKSGQLVVASAEECGLTDGFSPSNVIDGFKKMAQEALQQGYKAFRGTGDRCWSLFHPDMKGGYKMSKDMKERLIDYEGKVNRLTEEIPFIIGLCRYDRRLIDEPTLSKIMMLHPRVAVNRELFDNFYYIPPEKFGSQIFSHQVNNLAARKKVDLEMKKKMNEVNMINQILKQEIEHRSRAEHEVELLAMAQKQRSEFVAQMSHEIRSPLHGIMASGSLLLHSPLHEAYRDIVDTIDASTRQLLLIITKVLDPNPNPNPNPNPSSPITLTTTTSSSFPVEAGVLLDPPLDTACSVPPRHLASSSGDRRGMMHSRSSPDISSSPRAAQVFQNSNSPPSLPTHTPSPFLEVSRQFPRVLHVLIVDDSVINKRVLERMLERLERVVIESAEDGSQAVELCSHRHFDVILMDIFMPVLNGLEATREINNQCKTRRRKPVVVAVTASVTEEIKRECVEDLGMAAFITKPINVSVFLQMFSTIIPKLSE